jgi:hypothetical protein
MRKRILVLVTAVMMALSMALSSVAFAAITTTQENGGGNTPNGNANGVPTVSSNPAGHQPPGQND